MLWIDRVVVLLLLFTVVGNCIYILRVTVSSSLYYIIYL